MVSTPLQGSGLKKEPWAEMEKGLRLCGVENITYRTSCFIKGNEGERFLRSEIGPIEQGLPAALDCGWSMEPGYENGETLLQVCGGDRGACCELWRRLERAVGFSAASSGRSWSVEAYQSGDEDLMTLGGRLLETTGARLRSTYAGPRMVQLLAYLPWAGEGFSLDEGAVNLQLELYRIAGTEKIRIRLGIPVLHPTVF